MRRTVRARAFEAAFGSCIRPFHSPLRTDAGPPSPYDKVDSDPTGLGRVIVVREPKELGVQASSEARRGRSRAKQRGADKFVPISAELSLVL